MVHQAVSNKIKCTNPRCSELLDPVRRRNNKTGRSQYCSRKCYHEWSPGLEEVYNKLRKHASHFGVEANPDNPVEFMGALVREVYNRYSTWTARAAIIGVARQTFYKWMKQFGVKHVRRIQD